MVRFMAEAAALLELGGSEWESNPSVTSEMPLSGFEDRADHRTRCASVSLFYADSRKLGLSDLDG